MRGAWLVLLFCVGCAGLAPRQTTPAFGPSISMSFDIHECKLREGGYMRKSRFLSFSGKSSKYGAGPLCTIQIPKTRFESLFYMCALSGYALEPGAMPAGTPASEYEKVFTQPRMCGFRHLDTSGRYIFEGFGPGRCSFVCLPKQSGGA